MNRSIRHSKTKIIATLGPATSSKEKIKEIVEAGIDVCRLNFSHGNHEDHLKLINIIHEINEELDTDIAILGDLQGPKIRLGDIENGKALIIEDNELELTTIECTGNSKKAYVSYVNMAVDVAIGDHILIDDGKIKLEVIRTDRESSVQTRVLHGGLLKPHKGVNLPHTRISVPSLTEKDIRDVEFVIEHDLDWIALSFVRHPSDIVYLKEIIRKNNGHAMVIAKIEKPEAIKEIHDIVEEADGIMVARGDLGVEVAFDRVPYLQKMIVKEAIWHSKPVIIATQMLESMIENFRPTRAEANDIANSVYDGADTLMLSGETSVGQYPIEAIKSMQSIIDTAETSNFIISNEHLPDNDSTTYLPDSICYNACKMADQSNAKAIVAFSVDGKTAFNIASNRPNAQIYVFTPNLKLIKQLALVWNIRSFYIDPNRDANGAIEFSVKKLKHLNLIKNGDILVHVTGIPVFKNDSATSVTLGYV